MLAELPLPVYVTTDYDSNMTDALSTLATKDPRTGTLPLVGRFAGPAVDF